MSCLTHVPVSDHDEAVGDNLGPAQAAPRSFHQVRVLRTHGTELVGYRRLWRCLLIGVWTQSPDVSGPISRPTTPVCPQAAQISMGVEKSETADVLRTFFRALRPERDVSGTSQGSYEDRARPGEGGAVFVFWRDQAARVRRGRMALRRAAMLSS